MEMTMAQYERLEAKLDNVLSETGEMRTEQARACLRLDQIEAHLAKLNGRTGRSEDRLNAIEMTEAERRGAWKLMMIAASLPASVIAAGAAWWVARK